MKKFLLGLLAGLGVAIGAALTLWKVGTNNPTNMQNPPENELDNYDPELLEYQDEDAQQQTIDYWRRMGLI